MIIYLCRTGRGGRFTLVGLELLNFCLFVSFILLGLFVLSTFIAASLVPWWGADYLRSAPHNAECVYGFSDFEEFLLFAASSRSSSSVFFFANMFSSPFVCLQLVAKAVIVQTQLLLQLPQRNTFLHCSTTDVEKVVSFLIRIAGLLRIFRRILHQKLLSSTG